MIANIHIRGNQKIKADIIALGIAGGRIAIRGIFSATGPKKRYFRGGIYLKKARRAS